MSGKPPRRAGTRIMRFLGGLTALGLTLGLLGGLLYSFANLEQLKEQFSQAGSADDPVVKLNQAADSAIGFAQEMSTPPPSDRSVQGYRFSHPAPAGTDGDAAHWCAAQVIGYRIDFTAALAAGSTKEKERFRWQQALAEWTRASRGRYRFEYRGAAHYPLAGATTASYLIEPELIPAGEIAISYGVPPAQDDDKWAEYRHPALADALGVAGLGPVEWSSGAAQGDITTGMIVLDALDSQLDPRSVPVPYIHEAGHALGLSHVADPGQMMYDTAIATSRINTGDREGISRLAAMPCD